MIFRSSLQRFGLRRFLTPAKSVSVFLFFFTASSFPAVAQLVANGTYTISNRYSGQLVDVSGAVKTQGGVIDQYPATNGTNQQWKLTNLGSNVVELINVNSGLALDVYGASTGNGAEIDQWPYSGNSNQRWKLVSEGSGYYELIAGNSGLALDDPAYSKVNGADLDQYTPNAGSN